LFQAITILRFEVIKANMYDWPASFELEVMHRNAAECIDDEGAAN